MRMDKEPPEFTAKCRTDREGTGFRLTFFCDVCAGGYVTPLLVCDSLKEALRLGEQDARLHFNRCGSCRRWVCDEHFNENRMMCTLCAPRICQACKADLPRDGEFCTVCGATQFEGADGKEESV